MNFADSCHKAVTMLCYWTVDSSYDSYHHVATLYTYVAIRYIFRP